MMRLDEIGENYDKLKAKVVVSYTTNKTEPTRGGQNDTHVPLEVDHVGNERGMMGHFARDCRRKGKEKRRRRRQGKRQRSGDHKSGGHNG